MQWLCWENHYRCYKDSKSFCVYARTFPWHNCSDSSEVHHRWAAILHVLHRNACLEFPAERDEDERRRADETQDTRRGSQREITRLHGEKIPTNRGGLQIVRAGGFSLASGRERNKVLSFNQAGADTNSFIINGSPFQNILERLDSSWRYFKHNWFGIVLSFHLSSTLVIKTSEIVYVCSFCLSQAVVEPLLSY